jgi:hypothetical protein
MCTFLTVGVDPARRQALVAALTGAGLRCVEQDNPHVRRCFPAGRSLLLVTAGGCSCGLEPVVPTSRATMLRRRKLRPGQLARALAAPATVTRSSLARLALQRVLQAHRPVETFFHAVSGDPRLEAVTPGAVATTLT